MSRKHWFRSRNCNGQQYFPSMHTLNNINSWADGLCFGGERISNQEEYKKKHNWKNQRTFHSWEFRECVEMNFCMNVRNLKNFTVDQRACKPNGIMFECFNWLMSARYFFRFVMGRSALLAFFIVFECVFFRCV